MRGRVALRAELLARGDEPDAEKLAPSSGWRSRGPSADCSADEPARQRQPVRGGPLRRGWKRAGHALGHLRAEVEEVAAPLDLRLAAALRRQLCGGSAPSSRASCAASCVLRSPAGRERPSARGRPRPDSTGQLRLPLGPSLLAAVAEDLADRSRASGANSPARGRRPRSRSGTGRGCAGRVVKSCSIVTVRRRARLDRDRGSPGRASARAAGPVGPPTAQPRLARSLLSRTLAASNDGWA